MDGSALQATPLIARLENCDTQMQKSADSVVSKSLPVNQLTQHLVLLGAASAHLRVLAALAAKPLPDTQVTLVAAQPYTLPGPLLPGFIAGHTTLDDCTIALGRLVEHSGVRWVQLGISRLDTAVRAVHLSNGSALPYNWLSIANGLACNREQVERTLPGARERALFVHPVEPFAALWPRVAALGDQRPLRLTVMGHDAQAVEIAMAVRHRLPQAAVTLLCGDVPPAAVFPPPVRQQLLLALKDRGVTVLQDHALAIHADTVELGCGASLACDVVLLADRSELPTWLTSSGLALDGSEDLAVDASLRSTNHGKVFGVPARDASTRSATLLVRNLQAALARKPLQLAPLQTTPVRLISFGGPTAMATWGQYSVQGNWIWRLKNWLDHRQMSRYFG